MRFIGVDLGWTVRGGTGLCDVQAGCVVESTRLSTDREIVEWLTARTGAEALVAIDAPLIVRNPTGRRPCEQRISRCFGAQHASTHSANLGLPAFREGVRGALLAASLGLDVDPAFPPGHRVRRAIEVYPHPAIVALFDLPVTLKYKAKPGRSLEARGAALTELAKHLESLVDANPPLDVRSAPQWGALTRMAAQPTSGAALARVEDELDAYVCAYIGLYYLTHGTERCRVVGDLASGYIVTPVNAQQALCLDRQSSPAPRVDEAAVLDAFCRWLEEAERWHVEREVEFVDARAERGDDVLYVEAKGLTSSPGLDIDTLYGQLLRRMLCWRNLARDSP